MGPGIFVLVQKDSNAKKDSNVKKESFDARTLKDSLPYLPLEMVFYYETIKWELKIKPISEYRCDERQKTKVEESTLLSDTGLFGEQEHPKIKTRKDAALGRARPTLDLRWVEQATWWKFNMNQENER